MLSPRSVALVGVSGRADSTMARPLKFLREHGFEGALYPINPNYTELEGRRCYASLDDVPRPIDLVLIMVPARAVCDVIRQAGAAGAAAAIVFASGFGETGTAGAEQQRRLAEVARAAGVRVLGPNCQGLVYAPARLCATFTSAALRRFAARDDGVAYVGQSGAIGGSILDLANEMGIGLTAWASTGNQADLDLVELAHALLRDDAIRVLMLYVEAIGDGRAFTALARAAAESDKHLVVLWSGRSAAGQRAAASHTGAMLGNEVGFELVARRYGVTLVDDLDELLAVAAARANLAPMRGRRVAVVTTSGGAGSLVADRCADHELTLPELDRQTQDAIAPLIPDFGAVANPVDVTAQILGSREAFADVCRATGRDAGIDGVIVLLTMVVGDAAEALARDLVDVAQTLGKPVLLCWLAGHDLTRDGRQVLREAGMPVFASIDAVARSASLLAHASAAPERSDVARIDHARVDDCLEAERMDGNALLDALAIARPDAQLVTDAEAARQAVVALGSPAAMKIVSAGVHHKSDIGGVRLDVTADEAPAAFDALLAAAAAAGIDDVDGVQVQPMLAAGVELVIGATASSGGFPPIVSIGAGGVTTELYADTAAALAPVDAKEAEAMLRRLRTWPLLDGFRGAPKVDLVAAVDVIVRVSECMVLAGDRLAEFEINPLIVAAEGQGATAVDVLVARADARLTDDQEK